MTLADDAAPDTVIGTKSEKMPRAYQGNVDVVCQDKTPWIWTLTRWFETLQGRLSVSATNATRPVVQQGRLSMLYVHAKGLSLSGWLRCVIDFLPWRTRFSNTISVLYLQRGKKVQKETNICHWRCWFYLFFFSSVTRTDTHWTAGMISNYRTLCVLGLCWLSWQIPQSECAEHVGMNNPVLCLCPES